MDEEGHLKIADFGSAVENMWPGEKIQEDWVTGTPSFMAPEVSLVTSLTSNKIVYHFHSLIMALIVRRG